MKRRVILISVFLIFIRGNDQQHRDLIIESLDPYYYEALKDWNVAGMAVAIVKDGDVIFSRGNGVRNIDTGEPVYGSTL